MRSFHLGRGVVALLAVVLTVGCARPSQAEPPVAAKVTIEDIDWHGWEAVRLDDGEYEAIVVPSIQRVMHFGPSGKGEAGNVLWVNPKLLGEAPKSGKNWQNYGGDKLWPWPQNGELGWDALFGTGNWPPPIGFRGVAWERLDNTTSRIRSDDDLFSVEGVRLRSPPIEPGSMIAMRFIGFNCGTDSETPGLIVSSSMFSTVQGGPPNFDPRTAPEVGEVGAWHVTQIPRPGSTVVALADANAGGPDWMAGDKRADDLAKFVVPVDGDFDGMKAFQFVPMKGSAKAGLDARVLAAGRVVAGEPMAFVQVVIGYDGRRFIEADDLAQVYVNSEDAGDLVSWTELEFAGPVGDPLTRPTLSVRWLLVPVKNAADPVAVAKAAREAAREVLGE